MKRRNGLIRILAAAAGILLLAGGRAHADMEPGRPEGMRELFAAFFPDWTYEDGYVQEDRTVTLIGRKEDGTLVLLCGADEGGGNWEWTESTPLPEGTRIGDENITDAVNMNAWQGGAAVGVKRLGKGRWSVYYVNSYDFFVGPEWVGDYGNDPNTLFFGDHAWGDITTIDWSTLPPEEYIPRETAEEKNTRISGYVDRTGWAVPSQADPEGTTPLLEEAGNEASVAGLFYNGTPLRVLERGDEWTKVRIGTGEGAGTMTGWMRTEDLVFGDDMLKVSRERIQFRSEKVLILPEEQVNGSRAGTITGTEFHRCLVIGETEGDPAYAIIYILRDGDVGLIPEDSLGDGNG